MSNFTKISLNLSAISKIPFEKYADKFSLFVDGREYCISRLEADIISPMIRTMHFTDDSIKSFSINTNNKFPECNFSDFLSLLTFQPRSYDSKTVIYIKYIFDILGNFEESNKIQIDKRLTIDNVIDQIEKKRLFYQSTDSINEEIEFLSSHFIEIDKEKVKKLEKNIIDLVLKNEKLKIEDEDSLLKFIIELYMDDTKSSYLFENVNFLNVSKEKLTEFFDIFNFNDLTTEVWKSIMNHCINSSPDNCSKIEFINGQGLNGILDYLTNKAGGNIYEKGIINITSSSVQSNHEARHLCDFNNLGRSSMWSPNGVNNATVTFDFKEKKVKLSSYSFHTPSVSTHDYPKSWLIECSNDANNWDVVDDRNNEEIMNNYNICRTFQCMNKSNEFYRFIRIKTNGPCWNPKGGRYFFDLAAVEFFGILKYE